MPVTTPELFWLLAEEIRQCICDALEEESPCGCPCRSYVAVGEPAWDDCCEGQLTVSMPRAFVRGIFPQQEQGTIICSSPLAGEFVVMLLRCAPAIADDGTPPAPEVLTESSLQIYQEMYIAVRALICCLASKKRRSAFAFRDAATIGPEGGCVGFIIRVAVDLPDPPV